MPNQRPIKFRHIIFAGLLVSFIPTLVLYAQGAIPDLRLRLIGDAVASREFMLEINLGESVPINNLHGLSFRIRSKTTNAKFVDESVGVGPFFGSGLLSIRRKIDDHNVDIAITRTNGIGQSGKGLLGWIGFISTTAGLASFEIVDIKAVAPSGNAVSLEGKTTEFPVLINTSTKSDEDLPISFKVYPNYPNPFNPSTTLHFSLIESAIIDISIYDVSGRLVHETKLGHHSAGEHRINFDASMLNSGLYVYKLRAGHNIVISKMSLVK
jgi:hypothetical protein